MAHLRSRTGRASRQRVFYSVRSHTPLLLSAVCGGGGRLLPAPENPPAKVFNLSIGTMRTNQSWTVGRVLRDLELRAVRRHPIFCSGGVRITIFDVVAKEDSLSRRPIRHLPYSFVQAIGLVVALVQLSIAAIPWGLRGRGGH